MTEATKNLSRGSAPADDEIDLGRLFGLLLDHKYLIVVVTAIFTLVGVTYALLATPVYQGDALVQVEKRSPLGSLGGLGSLIGDDADNSAAAEMQILQSRMVLGQVVDRLGLDTAVVPEALPVVGGLVQRRGIERPDFLRGHAAVWGDESLQLGRFEVADALRGEAFTLRAGEDDSYQLFYEERLVGEGRVGTPISVLDDLARLNVVELTAAPGAEFELVKQSRAAAIRQLGSRLSVTEEGGGRSGGTGMLRLTLSGTDPQEIQRVLDALSEVFLLQNVERQSAEAEQSLEFLREQVPELRSQLAAAEDQLNEYRVELDSVDLSSESQAAIQQFIELESRISELEFQEAELAQRFTRNHPSYQSLLRQRRHLIDERAELNQRVNNLPTAQQEVVRLTRDVEVTQAIYVSVLNKVQELEVARAGTVGNVRIIDRALVGDAPIAPKKPLIVVLATLLGGMLVVGFVLVRGLLNRGVESPEQIEELGLPVYATVPLSEEQYKLVKRIRHKRDKKSQAVSTGVLAERAPADTSIEALRGLRTSLHFAMMESGNNRLMITGPSPGVGKSFISTNLGAVCAQGGQKVLVVDADMRKGHIHAAFGEGSEGGLSDFLSGQRSLDEVVRKTSLEGLTYIARGMAPPNPSELLMTQRFNDFLDQVSQQFDLVIIDTPPILAVTDAAIVGKQCGTTLMVNRFQLNPAKEIEIARRRLETAGVEAKGAILNAMERKAAASYGYGYYNYSYK